MERHSIPRLKSCGPWSEQTSSSGKRYYYNKETEVSQWEKPQEWREAERKLERSHHKRSNNSASTNAKVSTTSTKPSSVPTVTTTPVVNNSATQRHHSSTTNSGHNTPSQAHNNANASRVIPATGAQVSSNHTSTAQRSKVEASSKLLSNSHSHSQTRNGGSSRGASNSPLLIASVPTASPSSAKPPQLPVKVEPAAKAVSSSPSARSSPRESTRSPATYPTAIKNDWSAVKASPKSLPSCGGERKQSAVSNGTLRGPPPPVVVTRAGFTASSHQATTCSSTTTTTPTAKVSPPINPIQSIPSTSATAPVATTATSTNAVRVNGQNGQGPAQADLNPEVKPQPVTVKETPTVRTVKRPFEHLEVANASQPSTSQISTMEARYAKFYRPDFSAHRRNWNGDHFMEQSRKVGEKVLRQKLLVATLDNDLTSVRSLMRTAEVRTELISQKGNFLREQLEAIEAKPTVQAVIAAQPHVTTSTEAPMAQSATTVT